MICRSGINDIVFPSKVVKWNFHVNSGSKLSVKGHPPHPNLENEMVVDFYGITL
jgi:hypothetical protein